MCINIPQCFLYFIKLFMCAFASNIHNRTYSIKVPSVWLSCLPSRRACGFRIPGFDSGSGYGLRAMATGHWRWNWYWNCRLHWPIVVTMCMSNVREHYKIYKPMDAVGRVATCTPAPFRPQSVGVTANGNRPAPRTHTLVKQALINVGVCVCVHTVKVL